MPFTETLLQYSGISLLLLLAVSTLLTEDGACIAAGLLVAGDKIHFAPAVLACFSGIMIGDMLLYQAGKTGNTLLARYGLDPLSSARLQHAIARFRRYGLFTIFISRFIPGMRLPTFTAAGMLRIPFLPVMVIFGISTAIWTPLIVGISTTAGEQSAEIFRQSAWKATLAAIIACISVILLIRFSSLLSHTIARQLFFGKIRSWLRWEYWPAWLIHGPVLLFAVPLFALRYRSITAFASANPGIEAAGGLVGESKSSILRALSSAPSEYIAQWQQIHAESIDDRKAAVLTFMQAHQSTFPVVLKPDTGQRGEGVCIVHNESEFGDALLSLPNGFIAQLYIPGVEFGALYRRYPGESTGRIISLTRKQPHSLCGDGSRTLMQLIAADKRAACQAKTLMAANSAQLQRIPATGEIVPLTRLGSHCRGAQFFDATDKLTPQLEAALNQVATAHSGFYLGRFDLRAPNDAAFYNGQFKVIELNGTSSEPTHMYDAKHGLAYAYTTLYRYYRDAWQIGSTNLRNGCKSWSLREIIALLR